MRLLSGQRSGQMLGQRSRRPLATPRVRGGLAASGCAAVTGLVVACVLSAGLGAAPAHSASMPVAWGDNDYGQLGNDTKTDSSVPVAVSTSPVLAGKTIIAVSGGYAHSLALSSDGKVYAWGWNDGGQLGDGTRNDSDVPVAVDTSGVLAGKTIIAIAAGNYHSLALSSDGKVYAWGSNYGGQLGDGTRTFSTVPVAVRTGGVLAGKTIIAIAGGYLHSLAVDSDGKVYAWGSNFIGQLGNGGTTSSATPVAVNTSGVLAGKTIIAVSCGFAHSLAVDSDGKVYAWGSNGDGQLGNGTETESDVPLAVDMSGVLAGKTITAVASGDTHSLALSSDGKVYAWGWNATGQLGDGTTTGSTVPLAVSTSGTLDGKIITAIASGRTHNLALGSNGKVYAWGANDFGQLGVGTGRWRLLPVVVNTTGVLAGQTVTTIAGGYHHSLAVARETCPAITLLPGILLDGTVNKLYNHAITTSGGTAPYSFTLTAGTLPDGLTLSSTGVLSGTPTIIGSFGFTVQATDANGCTGRRVYTLQICPAIQVLPATLTDGQAGLSYGQTLTASGGTAPYTFSITRGTLPDGLTLSGAGNLAGTPTTGGDFTFTVRATDDNGCNGFRNYTLHINP